MLPIPVPWGIALMVMYLLPAEEGLNANLLLMTALLTAVELGLILFKIYPRRISKPGSRVYALIFYVVLNYATNIIGSLLLVSTLAG